MSTPVAKTKPRRRLSLRVVGTLLLAVGALVLWASGRLSWVEVTASDDKAGEQVRSITGAAWSTESTAIALVIVAAVVAVMVLRRAGRRFAAAVAAIAAGFSAIAPVNLLLSGAPATRARELLVTGSATEKANAPKLLSQWAEVTSTVVHPAGPWLAVIGCGVAVAAALVVIAFPGANPISADRFTAESQRRETIGDDVDRDPDSGRVMWDALDADIDPTDIAPSGSAAGEGAAENTSAAGECGGASKFTR